MGLELYQGSDCPPDICLSSPGPTSHRHFPISDSRSSRARPAGRDKLFRWAARAAAASAEPDLGAPTLPDWKLRELEGAYRRRGRGRRGVTPAGLFDAELARAAVAPALTAAEVHECVDLARSSSFRLPPASGARRRPPSLERQEAFRDASTCKRRRSLDDGHFVSGGDPSAAGFDEALAAAAREAEETAELYRVGLLYDDFSLRGTGFGFAALDHSEPAYTVRFSPSSRGSLRGRRRRKNNGYRSGAPSPSPHVAATPFGPLPLDLSFRALGDDDAIAAFLISPDAEEFAAAAASDAGDFEPERAERGVQASPAAADGDTPPSHDPHPIFASPTASISASRDAPLASDPRCFSDVSDPVPISPMYDDATFSNETAAAEEDDDASSLPTATAFPGLIADDGASSTSSDHDWAALDDDDDFEDQCEEPVPLEAGQMLRSVEEVEVVEEAADDESSAEEERPRTTAITRFFSGWIMVD